MRPRGKGGLCLAAPAAPAADPAAKRAAGAGRGQAGARPRGGGAGRAGKGGLCLAAPAAPAADPAAMRAAAAAKLRAAAAARRAELVRAQRGFNIDGDGLPELLLAAPEPAGFERLAVLRRHVATLEAWGGGFIAFQRQILRNITLVCLPHLFGADFEAARARLCEMFATDVLQAWTFTVAPRRVGKTETTMLALGALVAAGAYLDLLFMHETRDTVMKDIADMVAAAQRCDPALEWRGDRKGVSWLVRKGRAEHAAEIDFGSFTQPNVNRPPPPLLPPGGGPLVLGAAGALRRRLPRLSRTREAWWALCAFALDAVYIAGTLLLSYGTLLSAAALPAPYAHAPRAVLDWIHDWL